MGISKRIAEAFLQGEEKATETVYLEFKNLMYFIIASYVPSKEDCDDLLSESFMKDGFPLLVNKVNNPSVRSAA